MPLAWIDALIRRLPDGLTVPAYAGTAFPLLAAATADGQWSRLLTALLTWLALAGGPGT
ncbi:MAG TPA: hypothetical protein VN969_03620 [Streptosporangiaceae bacterium]|nr:hypothetical protein [Streptosporangiaceae bacterium]